MASLRSEQCGKGQLCSSITFPEGVDCIQVREEHRGLRSESLRLPSSQEICAMQAGEQRSHLTSDVLGEAEGALILGHPHGSVASSPPVDVLEEMPMYSAIMRGGEAAVGKRLFSAGSDAERLKGAEFGLVAQAELVLQNGRAGVAIPIWLSVVKVGAQAFFPNWRAIARRRSSLEAPVRSRTLSVRFDSADRWIPSTAEIFAIGFRPRVMLSRMRPSRP